MPKLILAVLDGLGYDAATAAAGYLEHLTSIGQAAKYRLLGEMPPVSRPMYETLLTGLPVSRHGILTNDFTRSSRCENLFSLASAQKLTTAAAAYYWVAELYNGGPFDWATGRYQLDSQGLIRHGIYYFADNYPDSHLMLDGEYLRRSRTPDFLLVHSMNCDDAGHRFGSNSREYAVAAVTAFNCLDRLLPLWRQNGYDVVITADHGMDELGIHSGNRLSHRQVPLYILSQSVPQGDFTDQPLSNLCVAPLCCRLLGLTPTPEMMEVNVLTGEKTHE
ncbi:MAG: alkaline phosphatase family protein [Peptococcaceae bacterium]|nr:alkaline phosphatase family protein [Peptococcaceae bacterium]